MTDDRKLVRARTIDADSLASWGASWDAGVDVPDDVVGGIIDYAEQLLRKTRADDLRIAELEAAWDRYRHDIAELTAQVEQLTAERDEAVRGHQTALRLIAKIDRVLHGSDQ